MAGQLHFFSSLNVVFQRSSKSCLKHLMGLANKGRGIRRQLFQKRLLKQWKPSTKKAPLHLFPARVFDLDNREQTPRRFSSSCPFFPLREEIKRWDPIYWYGSVSQQHNKLEAALTEICLVVQQQDEKRSFSAGHLAVYSIYCWQINICLLLLGHDEAIFNIRFR